MSCFFEDSNTKNKMEIFTFVRNEMMHKIVNVEISLDKGGGGMRKAVMSRLVDLVALSALKTVELVSEIFSGEIRSVLEQLMSETRGGEGGDSTQEIYLFNYMYAIMVTRGDEDENDTLLLASSISDDEKLMFIELMAKYKPGGVYAYLGKSEDFRTAECLNICKRYDIADASAYLLERSGNVGEALRLILKTFEEKLVNLKLETREGRGGGAEANGEEGAKQILVVALDLCRRNTVDGRKDGFLYFSVLDRLIKTKSFLHLERELEEHTKIMENIINNLIQHLMQTLVDVIPLDDIVEKITTDHSRKKLGEFREMVMAIFTLYEFELNLCVRANDICEQDMSSLGIAKKNRKVQGSSVGGGGGRMVEEKEEEEKKEREREKEKEMDKEMDKDKERGESERRRRKRKLFDSRKRKMKSQGKVAVAKIHQRANHERLIGKLSEPQFVGAL